MYCSFSHTTQEHRSAAAHDMRGVVQADTHAACVMQLLFGSAGNFWVPAGSHKEGQPRRRFLRDANGKLSFDKPSDDFDLTGFDPLEVKVRSCPVAWQREVLQEGLQSSETSRVPENVL